MGFYLQKKSDQKGKNLRNDHCLKEIRNQASE